MIVQTLVFYSQSLIGLLIEPGQFFQELPGKISPGRVFGFACICCGFFTLAGLLTGEISMGLGSRAVALMAGSFGTMIMASILGYLTMVMLAGRLVPFFTLFGMYVFAFGITLFVSWLPFLLWITEPWKWWLVFTGYRHTCSMNKKQALMVLLISMAVQFVFMGALFLALGNRVS